MICIPITETSAAAWRQSVSAATTQADLIELRMDYLPDADRAAALAQLPHLAAQLSIPFLLTFRPREQGGMRDMDIPERLAFWQSLPDEIKNAIAWADLELDLVEHMLAHDIPPPIAWEKVICSQHDFERTPPGLDALRARIAATPAAVMKIATKANEIADCLEIFSLIDHAPKPVISLGMGMAGVSTRMLGPSRGAMLTFGALRRGAESASGQPTAAELRDLYRAGKLNRDSLIMGVIGNPVGHSRSPLIHNTALRALDIDGVYLPLEVMNAESFMRDFAHPATRRLAWNLRGLSVTIPHKLAVMPLLDHIDEAARAVGAVNTIVVAGNELHGYNTDVAGAMAPLENLMPLRDARVAVLGAGGAARSIIYGLGQRGAHVTLYARNLARARTLAAEFQVEAMTIEQFAGNVDLAVNCTPVGMHGHDEANSPLRTDQLRNIGLVYDLIYIPAETTLLREARAAGCRTLNGMAMLIGQAAEQFRLWTGKTAPVDLMTEALEKALRE
ncbi:MAG: shikimate dehydrogenase [Blastocatellia bacterium]